MLFKLLVTGILLPYHFSRACSDGDCGIHSQAVDFDENSTYETVEGHSSALENADLTDGQSISAQKSAQDPREAQSGTDAPILIPYELTRQTAAKLPIPESVMNDQLRAWQPPKGQDNRYKLCPNDPQPYNILYHGVELLPEQKELVASFQAWVDAQGFQLTPTLMRTGSNEDLRFLTNHNFVFEETYEAMLFYENFLTESVVPLLEDYERVKPFLESGVFYGVRRDKMQRPVIVYNIWRANEFGMEFDDFMDTVDFLLMYTQFNANIEGKFESVNVIIDCADVGLLSIPVAQGHELFKRFNDNYKMRMHRTWIINASWVIRKAVQLLGDSALIYGYDDFEEELLEWIDADNLEVQYGGTLPTITHDFFPPQYNPVVQAEQQKGQETPAAGKHSDEL